MLDTAVHNVLAALFSHIASAAEQTLEFPRYDDTDAHARPLDDERIIAFDPETENDDRQ
jgi:hypothetical protein